MPPGAGISVELVVVEGLGWLSAARVLERANLQIGSSYGEVELAAATERVRQLPLVADVRIELRRGSERGRSVVVFTVTEAPRLFAGLDLDLVAWGSGGLRTEGLDREETFTRLSAIVGYRLPLGDSSLGFVAVGANDRSLTVGASNSDLFGQGVSASLAVSLGDCGDLPAFDQGTNAAALALGDSDGGCFTELLALDLDPGSSTWSTAGEQLRLSARAAVPLGQDRSLFAHVSLREVDEGLRRPAFEPEAQQFDRIADRRDLLASVSWGASSLDDPEHPSRGVEWQVGTQWREVEASLTRFILDDSSERPELRSHSRRRAAFASAQAHWPVSSHSSFSARGQMLVGRTSTSAGLLDHQLEGQTIDFEVLEASLGVGYSRLLDVFAAGERHELRWESDAGWQLQLARGAGPQLDRRGITFATGLAYRTGWGVLRLRLLYRDEDPG